TPRKLSVPPRRTLPTDSSLRPPRLRLTPRKTAHAGDSPAATARALRSSPDGYHWAPGCEETLSYRHPRTSALGKTRLPAIFPTCPCYSCEGCDRPRFPHGRAVEMAAW